jgi:glycerol uptake facilitator-like aquaporin
LRVRRPGRHVLSGDDNVQLGIGFLGVSLAFGLTVLTGAYAFGHVSGGHFNPAVSIGLAIAKRFDPKLILPYLVTQIVAATLAGATLLVIARGKDGFSAVESGFATNGYADRSPGGYGLLACLVIEVVLTAVFLYIILGATDDRAPKGFAPIAIGLKLTLIHLVSPGSPAAPPSARSGCSSWHRSSAPPSPERRTRRSPDRRSPSTKGSATTRTSGRPSPPTNPEGPNVAHAAPHHLGTHGQILCGSAIGYQPDRPLRKVD